jgi:molecular chaperone DnaK
MNVGIDLGTTYSLIARMGHDGVPLLLPDQIEQELVHTPSVVYIANESAFVGRIVETLLEQDPGLKVIRFFKRQFGQPDPIFFDGQGTPWFAESAAALVLKKLRFDAESFCSESVQSAVITVPAHFNDLQRKAVIAAAAMADVPVLGLVEEPVAAALHYGACQPRTGAAGLRLGRRNVRCHRAQHGRSRRVRPR